MPLTPGTRLGTCEILAPLGAGGMGEVYRAKDTALGREVAVKVLPAAFASDADRLRRFTQEAQAAAALNHPNILAIFHVGEQDGTPFIVSELLEGETVRDRLRAGAIPVRKAVEYTMQIAGGLASAHDKGIVHRDLKPENLFLTQDGRVKILDFGLAKLMRPEPGDGASAAETNTKSAGTGIGTVLGTAGYMSPEQVRAQPVDARTDLFSLGAILYEMVSGKRAFQGPTPADTMSAILREEPEPLAATLGSVPPALERIVRHCLEKNPYERFQSARDLKFDLSEITSLSSPSGGASGQHVAQDGGPGRGRAIRLGAAVLALAGAAGLGWWLRAPQPVEQPRFQRLTFRRGGVASARFAPDHKTIVYGAAWDGAPTETFLVTADSPESRSLGVADSDVLAISPSSELALALKRGPSRGGGGTLARVPLLGGAAPREVLNKVEFADWGSGDSLAVTLDTGVGDRLEYPVGTMLYEVPGPIHDIRVSLDGASIAFWEVANGESSIAVINGKKEKRALAEGFLQIDGLAWAPGGHEIWFAAEADDASWGIYAVTTSGRRRLILRFPGPVRLQDVSPERRVLVSRTVTETGMRYLAPGASEERDLSWLDGSLPAALSKDGKTLLFSELGEAGGTEGSVYVRKTDGSPAVRLGSGLAQDLSPDGTRALTLSRSETELRIIPLGVGAVQTLPGKFERYRSARFTPDGRVAVVGMQTGHKDEALYVQAVDGEARAISPEGLVSQPVFSPDGRRVIATVNDKLLFLSLDGGKPEPVPGIAPREAPVAWAADGKSVFVGERGNGKRLLVNRLDIASGARKLWKTLEPTDRAGLQRVSALRIGADEQSYVYSYMRVLGELYLVDGLR